MPKLIRLYIVNVAIGYGLSAVFLAMMVWFNVANLGHLILHTSNGWIGGLMMLVSNGVIFAGAQFAIAVMRQASDEDEPRGGTRAPALVPVPVAVKSQTRATLRNRR